MKVPLSWRRRQQLSHKGSFQTSRDAGSQSGRINILHDLGSTASTCSVVSAVSDASTRGGVSFERSSDIHEVDGPHVDPTVKLKKAGRAVFERELEVVPPGVWCSGKNTRPADVSIHNLRGVMWRIGRATNVGLRRRKHPKPPRLRSDRRRIEDMASAIR